MTSYAYVDPRGDGSEGDMTLLPEGDSHAYRTGQYGPDDLETGFYEIDYDVVTSERGIRVYDVYYLNDAADAVPPNWSVLEELLWAATEMAGDILDVLPEDFKEALDAVVDPAVLEEVDGIGPARSGKICEKLRFDGSRFVETIEAFAEHGLRFRKDSAACRWAGTFYGDYPEELEAFRENPYHVLTIANKSREAVRECARNHPSTTRARFALADIDEPVVDNDPSWKTSQERALAFMERGMTDVFGQGHTIARPEQIASEMEYRGMQKVRVEERDGRVQNVPVNAEVVRRLEPESNLAVSTTFVDAETGHRREGITTAQKLMRTTVIENIVHWLNQHPVPFSDVAGERMMRRALQTPSFELDKKQKQAVRHAFTSCMSVITGTAGTGKTTTLQAILNGAAHLLSERTDRIATKDEPIRHSGMNMYVTAPTGKAVRRIREGLEITDPETGEKITPQPIVREEIPQGESHLEEGTLHISTLHKFLGYNGQHWNRYDPHPSVIVVDESSMVDHETMYFLTRFVQNCLESETPVMLILLGDVEQLEPVGAGYPFRDLLGASTGAIVPATTLENIHRQGQGSAIIEFSDCVVNGEMPPAGNEVLERDDLRSDCYWHAYPELRRDEPLDLWAWLSAVAGRANCLTDGEEVTPRDVQVILPLRNPSSIERDALCTRWVNEDLQEIFAEQDGREIRVFDAENPDTGAEFAMHFAVGDRVVHGGRNGYVGLIDENDEPMHDPVERGTIGTVTKADEEKQTVTVRYPTLPSPVPYPSPEAIGQLDLAYAITGHTAQGSEFGVVATALPKEGGPTLMTRPWLHTTATRASRFLDVMATTDRIRLCVETDSGAQRQTNLAGASV